MLNLGFQGVAVLPAVQTQPNQFHQARPPNTAPNTTKSHKKHSIILTDNRVALAAVTNGYSDNAAIDRLVGGMRPSQKRAFGWIESANNAADPLTRGRRLNLYRNRRTAQLLREIWIARRRPTPKRAREE